MIIINNNTYKNNIDIAIFKTKVTQSALQSLHKW